MAVYSIDGYAINTIKTMSGNNLLNAYDVDGNLVFYDFELGQEYLGGYIEIQPDSWDGVTPVTSMIVGNDDQTAWGFPYSLSAESKATIKNKVFNGSNGIKYIRFPLGFAFRGARNVDQATGLPKNFGERWPGQNQSLREWFSSIAQSGGGLAPEYWVLPSYWLTAPDTGSGVNPIWKGNVVWAGGNYARTVTLKSIKTSDPTQYNAQIDALTDAIIDDYEYIAENIAPVVMFGLANEPVAYSTTYQTYRFDDETYSDILEVLYQKAHSIFPNALLHCSSDYSQNPWYIGGTYIGEHSNTVWGYSFHLIDLLNGENSIDGKYGADAFYKSDYYKNTVKTNKQNVFNNEYEYFYIGSQPNDFRCSNNMLRLIDDLWFGESQVLHPVIHICKPTGQTVFDTNTEGYCMYAVNMTDGSIETNPWAYNSWMMFNDNLPIGARVIKNISYEADDIGFVAVLYNNKIRMFGANCSNSQKTINIVLPTSKQFSAKLYNINNVGTNQGDLNGVTIPITIPAYSGICCIEN